MITTPRAVWLLPILLCGVAGGVLAAGSLARATVWTPVAWRDHDLYGVVDRASQPVMVAEMMSAADDNKKMAPKKIKDDNSKILKAGTTNQPSAKPITAPVTKAKTVPATKNSAPATINNKKTSLQPAKKNINQPAAQAVPKSTTNNGKVKPSAANKNTSQPAVKSASPAATKKAQPASKNTTQPAATKKAQPASKNTTQPAATKKAHADNKKTAQPSKENIKQPAVKVIAPATTKKVQPVGKNIPKPVYKNIAPMVPVMIPQKQVSHKITSVNLKIQSLVVTPRDNGALVTITWNQEIDYRLFVLNNPGRVVVDMGGVAVMARPAAINSTMVRGYRFGQFEPGQSRLVLESAHHFSVEQWRVGRDGRSFSMSFLLKKTSRVVGFHKQSVNWSHQEQWNAGNMGNGNKAGGITSVAQLIEANNGTTATGAPAVGALMGSTSQQLGQLINQHKQAPTHSNANTANRASAPTTTSNRTMRIDSDAPKPLIAIDAGHGGLDSGTIGRRGTIEKLINLAVAKEIAAALESTGRYRVFLTRRGDYFIPLRERYRMAERVGADFFLSIHADSFPDPNVLGASIYTLSNVASDKESEKLAREENKSDNYAGFLGDFSFDVKRILFDLTKRQKSNRSVMFADLLASNAPPLVPFLKNKPHRFANFTVMKSVSIPSVLFEMGFLSSERQEYDIILPPFRRNVARCMTAAFDSYFYNVTMRRGC